MKNGRWNDFTKDITRLTVVGDNGRLVELWDVHVTLSVQDDGRTLKVFAQSPEFLRQPVLGETS